MKTLTLILAGALALVAPFATLATPAAPAETPTAPVPEPVPQAPEAVDDAQARRAPQLTVRLNHTGDATPALLILEGPSRTDHYVFPVTLRASYPETMVLEGVNAGRWQAQLVHPIVGGIVAMDLRACDDKRGTLQFDTTLGSRGFSVGAASACDEDLEE